MKSVQVSLYFSIIVQIITFFLNIYALFVSSNKPILNKLLALELFVQIIEGSFYFYWYKNFFQIKNITPFRYIDWAISTPAMLVTLILYIANPNLKSQASWISILFSEISWISIVLILNWIMLLFGYLGETNKMSINLSVFLGFIPFIIYFGIIYFVYVKSFNRGYKLFYYFVFFWALYGIAALLPYKTKNSIYNILDLFSKNFFIVYLLYQSLF